jgi:hypothetical protein
MRKWGIVISVLYAGIVVGLLAPAGLRIAMAGSNAPFLKTLADMYTEWLVWAAIVIVIGGQAILLFLSVDTSQKRLKPRTHLAASVIAGSLLFALLAFAAFSAAGAAWSGDKFLDRFWDTETEVVLIFAAIWLAWGVVFYLYFRNSTEVTTRIISWLLKGSVLELLIAVPCHVIVRRREDCSAPIATSFGIVTGIAVMLLAFGPSVLLLYKKRLDGYAARASK